MITNIDPESPFFGDVGMLIGDDSEVTTSEWIDVEAPYHGTVLGRVPRSGRDEVDAAVQAARAAFPAWRDTPAKDRGRALAKAADLLEAEAERLARICSAENGNALRTQSRGEAAFLADCLRYFGGLAQEMKGLTTPIQVGTLDYTRRVPVGVVGAIVPWNAPLMLSALKTAPAIAMGNTVVLKVAEDAPFAVLEFAKIFQQMLPAGVLNVITGFGAEAGEALTSHPLVDKLTFTGSTAVGKAVMHNAADRIVPVSLELGGKSAQIVFPDADEQWVVDGVISGMRFFRQGQSCTAGSRVYVHESIIDSFAEKLARTLSAVKLGNPLLEETDMGSIVNKKQFDRVCSFITEAEQTPGYRIVLGGLPDPNRRGYGVDPTVVIAGDEDSRIMKEEIFGPIVCLIPWSEEEDVIARANNSDYGLAGFVWCHDIGKALTTAHRLEAGWIQVNQGGGQQLGQAYGGIKQSGLGREWSLDSMVQSFTHEIQISVNLTR